VTDAVTHTHSLHGHLQEVYPIEHTGTSNIYITRGLSGYRARQRVADSQGPVLVAGLALNK